MKWQVDTTKKVDKTLLIKLLDNEIAAIIVPGFVSEEVCKLAANGILAHGFDYYETVYPMVGKVGLTQFEYDYSLEQKKTYFANVPLANATRKEMFRDSGDFLPLVISYLKDAWRGDVDIALENMQEPYFAGLVRVMSNPLLLHYDWAPVDGPTWTISHISAQITWNIYIQTPTTGGSTIVYNRPWRDESDERYAIPKSYEYDVAAVRGVDSVKILPQVGDLVLFNSRNFHEVKESQGETKRISVSSFIGLLKDQDKLVFWS